MELNEYQYLASRTANKELMYNDEFMDYTLGLAGESGEFVEMVKKIKYHGHAMDNVKMAKELGDVLWYISQLARMLGWSLENVANSNILKLQIRYPEKFTIEDSIARVDTKEQG